MESVSGPWSAMSGKGVAALGVQQQHVQSGLETAYCKHAHSSFSVYSMRNLRNPPFVSHLFICACVFYSIHVEVREQVSGVGFLSSAM